MSPDPYIFDPYILTPIFLVWNRIAEEEESFFSSSIDDIFNICEGIQLEKTIEEIVDSLIELGLILVRREKYGN